MVLEGLPPTILSSLPVKGCFTSPAFYTPVFRRWQLQTGLFKVSWNAFPIEACLVPPLLSFSSQAKTCLFTQALH